MPTETPNHALYPSPYGRGWALALDQSTMRLSLIFLTITLFAAAQLNAANPKLPVVVYSPDRSTFVAWSDYEAGSPVDRIRSIVFRKTSDEWLYFSRVTMTRNTLAAWNNASTRCLLSDAPDNGNLFVWLIEKHSDEPDWRPITLDPLGSVEQQFESSSHGSTLWRPSILKIKWTDDTTIELRCYCNLGTYLITIDALKPTGPFQVKQLSEKFIEE